MNVIDMLFSSASKELVLSAVLGAILGFIVPYVNVTLRELHKQNLFYDSVLTRLGVYAVVCFPLALIMTLFGVHNRMTVCMIAGLLVIICINRNIVKQQVQPVVKWFAFLKYKYMMKPKFVQSEIKNSRNKYCLKEWLDCGWILPNGNPLCGNVERFKVDLPKIIAKCSRKDLEEWQVEMVHDYGYKFRDE